MRFIYLQGVGTPNKPAMVPCTSVPFLSSNVTVSEASFIRNLEEEFQREEKNEIAKRNNL
jgi:hypothetical protein